MLLVLIIVSRGSSSLRMTYVFQPIQILVSLATDIAFVRLLLFHAESSWVGGRSLRIHDRKRAVSILMQLLRLVTVRLVIPRCC